MAKDGGKLVELTANI